MNYYADEDEDDERGSGVKFYGTPFAPLRDEEAPSKKPDIDLTVRDEEGRRRFHGAFTGGFSAGYWNTVGSKEGWVPSQFVSNRKEKWDKGLVKGKPEDYMDEEDFLVHGIAPKSVHTTDLFSSDPMSDFLNKRLAPTSSQSASGLHSDLVDFLKQAVRPAKMSIGVQILKKMRAGSQSLAESRKRAAEASAAIREADRKREEEKRKKKKKEEEEEESAPQDRPSSSRQSYGCSLPPGFPVFTTDSSDDEEHEQQNTEQEHEGNLDALHADQEEEMVKSFACYKLPFERKCNLHGLGYKGMLQPSTSSSCSTSTSAPHSSKSLSLSADVAGKKLHISGDAFGIGVLDEENDAFDDVTLYEKEDMSIYDFEMRGERKRKSKSLRPTLADYGNRSLDDLFVPESAHTSSASKFQSLSKLFPPPDIPTGWRPSVRFPSPAKENTDHHQRDHRQAGLRSNDGHDGSDGQNRKRSRWDVRAGEEEGQRKSSSSLDSRSASSSKSSGRSMTARVMDANVRSLLLGEGIKLGVRRQSATAGDKDASVGVKKEEARTEEERSAGGGRLNHRDKEAASSTTPSPAQQRTALFGFFANKFTHSSSVTGADGPVKLEAGLTRPEDIRTREQEASARLAAGGDGEQSQGQASTSLIGTSDRISLPWMPTSLLCKRFNVPPPPGCTAPSSTRSKHY